jgi:hypothetical protein
MTLLIPSLTTLQNQLQADAEKLGMSVVNINKASRVVGQHTRFRNTSIEYTCPNLV